MYLKARLKAGFKYFVELKSIRMSIFVEWLPVPGLYDVFARLQIL